MQTPCSRACNTVRFMIRGSPAWNPVAMLAELIKGMIASSTPSPMVHGPNPSPMSELRSMLRLLIAGGSLALLAAFDAACDVNISQG
jgi:hypothetical protein